MSKENPQFFIMFFCENMYQSNLSPFLFEEKGNKGGID